MQQGAASRLAPLGCGPSAFSVQASPATYLQVADRAERRQKFVLPTRPLGGGSTRTRKRSLAQRFTVFADLLLAPRMRKDRFL